MRSHKVKTGDKLAVSCGNSKSKDIRKKDNWTCYEVIERLSAVRKNNRYTRERRYLWGQDSRGDACDSKLR